MNALKMKQLKLCVLLIFAIYCGLTHGMECHNGWVHFDDSCYWFARQNALPYTEAQHYCEQKNSKLVTVDSIRENLFLKDFLRALKTGDHWMGYRDEAIEGLWTWDTTQESGSFTDWGPGEPNKLDNEDCAAFQDAFDYKWIDASCNSHMEPICEMTSSSNRPDIVG